MKKTIFIVEDEKDIIELVKLHLENNGFKLNSFKTGDMFFKTIKQELPDLIILDLMLPDINGMEICKILKSKNETKKIPIIMLTARQDELDKILGLEIGADDYMTKPFSPRELVARVKSVFRRIDYKEDDQDIQIININGQIIINLQKYEVSNNTGEKINLTHTEFKLLKVLSEKIGWVYSREKLLDIVWKEDKYIIDRTVDVHIKNLREKLGTAGRLIKNVRGVGYKLEY